jgi:hypothetical protein
VLLSGSLGAFAQEAPAVEAKTLSSAPVREKTDPEQGRDRLRVSKTGIARGTQDLRDIPQSVTVITEKLMDDRNLDTLEALQYTAGISFLAVEGAEEDIRLRGFSLQATGADVLLALQLRPASCLRCWWMVNQGIRRGTDVLKALALGAHAVLIGRPAHTSSAWPMPGPTAWRTCCACCATSWKSRWP